MFTFRCRACNGISYSANADTSEPCVYCRAEGSVRKIRDYAVSYKRSARPIPILRSKGLKVLPRRRGRSNVESALTIKAGGRHDAKQHAAR